MLQDAQDEEADQLAPDGAADDKETPQDGDASGEEQRAKKQRGNKVEQWTRKINDLEKKLELEQVKVKLAEERGSKVAREIVLLEKSRTKVNKMESALLEMRGELEVSKQNAAHKVAADKQRQEKAFEKAEETRNMTEAGAMQLVSLRLKYQSRFDNTSDKADAIWAHIHDEFMILIVLVT